MSDGLLLVSSHSLRAAADELRTKGKALGVPPVLGGHEVSVPQLEAAAQILLDAEPSVITSPRRLAGSSETPGWLEREAQDDPEVLVFRTGIINDRHYRIARDGTVSEATP